MALDATYEYAHCSGQTRRGAALLSGVGTKLPLAAISSCSRIYHGLSINFSEELSVKLAGRPRFSRVNISFSNPRSLHVLLPTSGLHGSHPKGAGARLRVGLRRRKLHILIAQLLRRIITSLLFSSLSAGFDLNLKMPLMPIFHLEDIRRGQGLHINCCVRP